MESMKIDLAALEELRRICVQSFQKEFSDPELQEIGQRIIRFLTNSETLLPGNGEVDSH